ncbi:MAG TPA: HlyD family efflux transporter periplasmic adaptor subunit [Myxococcota bacterium]
MSPSHHTPSSVASASSPAALSSSSSALPSMLLVRSSYAAWVLAVALLIILAVFVFALVVTPWQQSIAGRGRVIALSPGERHQMLESPVDGRINRVLVKEGQRVEQDEIIVEIADVDPLFLERLQNEASLISLREQAASDRRKSIEDRVAALVRAREQSLSSADARIAMAVERVRQSEQALISAQAVTETATLNLPRLSELAAQGLRSQRDKELAELDLAKARAEEQRAQAVLTAANSEVASVSADRRRIEQETTAAINDARAAENSAKAEQAAARADIIRLDTRIARQQTQVVRAPRTAFVFRVAAQEGQLVKMGELLIELVPETTSRAVEIWVDGNDAPLVTAGRHVRLQFEGWPALQFVGWPSVARGTFGGEVTLVDVHDDGTGRFRVIVGPTADEPWPGPELLRQGVRANAWVVLETVPLGFEIWRRLNAFPPSLPPSKAPTSASTTTSPPPSSSPLSSSGGGGGGGSKGGK